MKTIPTSFKILVCLFCFLSYKNSFSQNVGISSSSSFTPDASAALDISYTSKGLLIPRVALTATNAAGPISSPATSLLVYNTATAGTSPYNVVPGYYYYNGSAWIMLTTAAQTASNAWSTTGNSGTNYSTNFLGNTDNASLRFRTNNTQRAIIDSLGNVGIGSANFTTSDPEKLLIDAGTTTSNNAVGVSGTINDFFQFNIQNLSNGTGASTDIVATANNGTDNGAYIDMGINSQGYTSTSSNILNKANTAYLYANASDFYIGNGTQSKSLIFFTNSNASGTTSANGTERMRIDGSGNIGINTTTGNSTLSINGSITYKTVTVSANYTATATDYLIINTGAGITVTLPAASSCTGRAYKILNHGTAAVTISPAITVANGSTGTTLNYTAGNNFLEVISDGSVYRKISL